MVYREYLSLFLAVRTGALQEYRTMDMIQLALRGKQKDFLMERCACAVDMGMSFRMAHVFAVPPASGGIRAYEVSVITSRSY